jgi:thioredoxin 1
MSAVKLTDESFSIETEKGVVVVDFHASWCAPCRMLAPSIDKLAQEWDGKVKIAKADADEAPASFAKFSIRSMPTIIIFKDGNPVDMLVGIHPRETISNRIKQVTD